METLRGCGLESLFHRARMNDMLRSISLFMIAIACIVPAAQRQRIRHPMSADAQAVLALIKAGDWKKLASKVDDGKGIVIAEISVAKAHSFSKGQFIKAISSKQIYTWAPPMGGDGWNTPIKKSSVSSWLKGLQSKDWSLAPYSSYDKSIEPGAYRTLFISNLAKKSPQSKFVEYYFGNPKEHSSNAFDQVLILGFMKHGSTYRLSAIGLDKFKD